LIFPSSSWDPLLIDSGVFFYVDCNLHAFGPLLLVSFRSIIITPESDVFLPKCENSLFLCIFLPPFLPMAPSLVPLRKFCSRSPVFLSKNRAPALAFPSSRIYSPFLFLSLLCPHQRFVGLLQTLSHPWRKPPNSVVVKSSMAFSYHFLSPVAPSRSGERSLKSVFFWC